MGRRFDYFVLLAEMRTGSNFLEANLNALDGVRCFGEAFNPHFIGYPTHGEVLGIDQSARDAAPKVLLNAIKDQSRDLGGFRYFHDHDPRIFETFLDDPRCAKIILSRNPVHSYISWKIAQETGQWKLTDVRGRKGARVQFVPEEFAQHAGALDAFRARVLKRLQTTGQTAFHLDYDDLQDVAVINGIAAFLGADGRLDGLERSLKVQNPAPLAEKVTNFDQMQSALVDLDRFDLAAVPHFEPPRGPSLPRLVAAARAPVLYMPIEAGPAMRVERWLAALDGVPCDDLTRAFSQKLLRRWKRAHPRHRSFTVIRHPLVRAHAVFCARILATGAGTYPKIRDTLRRRYDVPLPEGELPADWSLTQHRAAFEAFLVFLKANLQGQTAIRVDAAWCTQSQALQGFSSVLLPDMVIREDALAADLAALAARVGYDAPDLPEDAPDAPFSVNEVYTDALEAATRAAYQRDYMMFGFDAFRPL